MPPFLFIRQFERPRFYDGRLLTAADLEDEQDYFREKIRLHNRLSHGWGVVTGLKVSECANHEHRSSDWARRRRSHCRLWLRPSAVLGHDPSVRFEVAHQH